MSPLKRFILLLFILDLGVFYEHFMVTEMFTCTKSYVLTDVGVVLKAYSSIVADMIDCYLLINVF